MKRCSRETVGAQTDVRLDNLQSKEIGGFVLVAEAQ
jgi:hypothetical protein